MRRLCSLSRSRFAHGANAAVLFALGCVLMACSSPTSTSTVTIPTLVVVEPQAFTGSVPCAEETGGLQRYVATLQDVSPNLFGDAGLLPDADVVHQPDESFTLPSSSPLSCREPVGFGLVTPGHKYVADIDAYDRSDLVPAAAGSRVMLDAEGNTVSPRWTTDCGKNAASTGAGPAVCVSNWMVRLSGCRPLVNTTGPSSATLNVSLSGALGNLVCGNAPGQIAGFSVSTASPGDDEQSVETCDGVAVFPGLASGQSYSFALAAHEAGATTARWTTTCSGNAVGGTAVRAVCDPLHEQGGLVVDLSGWLSSAGLTCASAGLTEFGVAVLGADGVRQATRTGADCETPVAIEELGPGTYEIIVTTSGPSGAGPTGRCEAIVTAGTKATAICDPMGS